MKITIELDREEEYILRTCYTKECISSCQFIKRILDKLKEAIIKHGKTEARRI
jgi:hypothetical protein